jgi:hypothetical protein
MKKKEEAAYLVAGKKMDRWFLFYLSIPPLLLYSSLFRFLRILFTGDSIYKLFVRIHTNHEWAITS